MFADILTALKLIPDILTAFREFTTWLNHVSGNDPQGYVKRVGGAMSKLNNASTDQERTDAAKAIADAISGLH